MEITEFITLTPNEKLEFFKERVELDFIISNSPYIYKNTGEPAFPEPWQVEYKSVNYMIRNEHGVFEEETCMENILPDDMISIPVRRIYHPEEMIEHINIFSGGRFVLHYNYWKLNTSMYGIRYYIV